MDAAVIPEQTAQSAAPPDMERIVGAYGNAVLRMCFSLFEGFTPCRGCVTRDLLKVYRNYAQFDGTAGEKTWVMRIAINV